MIDKEEMGRRIREHREKSGMTREEMAELIESPPGELERWEKGESVPDLEQSQRIAAVCGTTVDKLLNRRKPGTHKMFHEKKMYTYLKGVANSRDLMETQKALIYARDRHANQFRKEGVPYIVHPLAMACNALAMGLYDDNLLATILLHDVLEDCGVKAEELPVNDTVKRGVERMTFRIREGETKQEAMERYYGELIDSKEASITKLIDRCHNVSSMSQAFSKEKLREYIQETRDYVLPFIKRVKRNYPELTDVCFILKYHIRSVVDSIEAVMALYEKEESSGQEG